MEYPAKLILFRGATYRLATSLRQNLVQGLGLSPEQASELLQAMQSANSPTKVDAVLDLANILLDGHGVEAIRVPGAHVDRYYYDIVGLYVNMGDTYIPTLVYNTRHHKFHVTSLGDL